MATHLAKFVDEPHMVTKDKRWDVFLRMCRNIYPKLYAAYTSKKKDHNRLTPAERLEVKQKLLDILKSYSVDIKRDISNEKLFFNDSLPADPDECLLRINEIEREEQDKLVEIGRRMNALRDAKATLDCLKENKLVVDTLDEGVFTSIPEARAAKKPKNG